MKKLTALILVVLCIFTLTACNNEKDTPKTAVYSFSGGNDYLYVTNGTIVLDGDEEIFSGGELDIIREGAFSDVSFFRTEFYIRRDSENRTVLVSEMHDMTGGSDVSISGDLGKISGGTVVTEGKQIEEIDLENNLFFKLSVTRTDGTTNSYTVQMDVEKV